MEVHGLRRVDDAELRRHRGEARGVPRVTSLEGLAGHDAGRQAVLHAQDGRVLGSLAHACPRRRAPPRAPRRQDLGFALPGTVHISVANPVGGPPPRGPVPVLTGLMD